MARIGFSGPAPAKVSRGRVDTGPIAGGGTAVIPVALAPEMLDLNFTATATVQDSAGDLRVLAVTGTTTSSATVLLSNADTLNAASGVLHVLAVHD